MAPLAKKKSRTFLLLIAAGALIFFVSAFRDAWILHRGHGLHAISGVDGTTWEENYSYAPLVVRCTLRNLFPADPYSHLVRSEFASFPYLVIWLQTIIYRLLHSYDAFCFVMHAVFPLITFFILWRLFRFFIPDDQAALLSFMTWFFCAERHLGFLVRSILNHRLRFWSYYVTHFSDIRLLVSSRFNSPAVTFCLFALTLLYTVKAIWAPDPKQVRLHTYFCVGLAWAAQIYIYYANFIVGVVYIGAFLVAHYLIKDPKASWPMMAKRWIVLGAGLFLGSMPAISRAIGLLATQADHDLLMRTGLQYTESSWVTFRSLGENALWMTPWIILLALGCKKSIRPIILETLKRLAPLLLLFPICLIAANLFHLIGRIPQPYRILLRIGNYAIFWSWLPVISVLSSFRDRKEIRQRIPALAWILFMCLACLAKWKTQLEAAQLYNRFAASEMGRIDVSLNQISHYAKSDETVVSSDFALNYALPIQTSFDSLLINGITSRVSDEEIAEKLALYAKIIGLSKSDFLIYMTTTTWPLENTTGLTLDSGEAVRLVDNAYFSRLGGWHMVHADTRRVLSPRYFSWLSKIYDACDVKTGVDANRISVIHVRELPLALRPFFDAKGSTSDGRKIYTLKSNDLHRPSLL